MALLADALDQMAPLVDALDARHDLALEHGQGIGVVAHLLLYHRVQVRAVRLEEVSVNRTINILFTNAFSYFVTW